MKEEKKEKQNTSCMSVLFQWKNILGFKEICSPLWSLKYFTYKKEVPKTRASGTSLT